MMERSWGEHRLREAMVKKLNRLTRRKFTDEHVDTMVDEILDIVARRLDAGFQGRALNDDIDTYVMRMKNRDRERHVK